MAPASRISAARSANSSRSAEGACSSAPVAGCAHRARAAHRAEGTGVAGEHRAACQRCTHLGRHTHWQSANRQPALTAHPLVSTLYKRLKQQYPLIQLAVRKAKALSSRRGSRTAASISRSFIERAHRRRMATLISSRHRPIWSAQPAIRSHRARRCRFQLCTICRSYCFAARAAGAIISSKSAPSAAFR